MQGNRQNLVWEATDLRNFVGPVGEKCASPWTKGSTKLEMVWFAGRVETASWIDLVKGSGFGVEGSRFTMYSSRFKVGRE